MGTPEQLQDVQYINVRPAFAGASKHNGTLQKIRARFRNVVSPRITKDIFSVAQLALPSCSEVEQLTISVNNDPLPPSFAPFLCTLWTWIGPRLKKLKVELTNAHLNLFFDREIARKLPQLQHFEMHLSPPPSMNGYFIPTPPIQYTLVPFAGIITAQLVSLTVSSKPFHADGLTLFFRTMWFPNLREFDITNPLVAWEPMFASLIEFISRHSQTLQQLTIRRSSEYPPSSQDRFLSHFPSFWRFPALHDLTIDVTPSTLVDASETQHLRLTGNTAPKLRSLLVKDMSVDTYYLPLSDDIYDSTLQLTHIQLSPKFLSSQIINQLMEMSKLEELELTYWDYGPYADLSLLKPID
ncbi:hypothetical protein H0H87_001925 [Tephrocybe sp. NHM501043]|nr:hypothetical protein H0H87_001925 [Tephrocybe sp. NHM501043]